MIKNQEIDFSKFVIFIKNWGIPIDISRSSRPEVLCKNGAFLEISQNSQEITCARVPFLIELQA